MKLKKEDIETVRDLDRRRLLKLGSVGAFVSIAGTSLLPKTAAAKDGDPGDPYDNDPYDDSDIRDGRTGRNTVGPKDTDANDPYDNDSYDDTDIRDGTPRRRRRQQRRYSDPADTDPYNGADSD